MNDLLSTTYGRGAVLILCAALFVVCDTLAANWGKNDSTPSLIAVIILSPLSYVTFGYLNQKYPLSIISSWIVLALCICTVLIGIFYFHDELTVRQGIGLGLSVIAISLLVF